MITLGCGSVYRIVPQLLEALGNRTAVVSRPPPDAAGSPRPASGLRSGPGDAAADGSGAPAPSRSTAARAAAREGGPSRDPCRRPRPSPGGGVRAAATRLPPASADHRRRRDRRAGAPRRRPAAARLRSGLPGAHHPGVRRLRRARGLGPVRAPRASSAGRSRCRRRRTSRPRCSDVPAVERFTLVRRRRARSRSPSCQDAARAAADGGRLGAARRGAVTISVDAAPAGGLPVLTIPAGTARRPPRSPPRPPRCRRWRPPTRR